MTTSSDNAFDPNDRQAVDDVIAHLRDVRRGFTTVGQEDSAAM